MGTARHEATIAIVSNAETLHFKAYLDWYLVRPNAFTRYALQT